MRDGMSIKAKIRAIANKHKIRAQVVLQSYMFERLLERVSLSRFKDQVILKGGLLIASLIGIEHRTTMDMDATVKNFPLSEEAILALIREICSIEVSDGVKFDVYAIEPTRLDDEYGGFCVSLTATYDEIRVPLKIVITTDDAITPGAAIHRFNTLFDARQFELFAYNIETVLAEKYETILRRGILNTRTRDFYDVYTLSAMQSFNPDILKKAILATAEKRSSTTFLPDKTLILQNIRSDTTMRQRWNLYCREYSYASGIDFDKVMDVLEKLYSH